MSRVRPSSLPMLAQCPFWTSGDDSPQAGRGRAIHEHFANILDPVRFPADTLPDLPQGDREEAAWAAAMVRQRMGTAEILVEEPVAVLDDDFAPIIDGTLDAAGVARLAAADTLLLFDLKTGRPHDYELQLSAYAWAAMERFGLSRCRAFLLYSMIRHAEVYDYSLEEVRRSVMRVIGEVRAAENGDGERRLNDYCRWCAECGSCEATARSMERVADGYAPAGTGPLRLSSWHPSELTDPREISLGLEAASLFEAWAGSMKHHAKEKAMAGMEIPGWTVRPGNKVRSLEDIEAAYQASGLSPSDFLKACSCSIPELESLMHEKPKSKAAREAFAERFDGLISTTEQAPTLVREKASQPKSEKE